MYPDDGLLWMYTFSEMIFRIPIKLYFLVILSLIFKNELDWFISTGRGRAFTMLYICYRR